MRSWGGSNCLGDNRGEYEAIVSSPYHSRQPGRGYGLSRVLHQARTVSPLLSADVNSLKVDYKFGYGFRLNL